MNEINPQPPAPQHDADPGAVDRGNAEQAKLDEAWAGLAHLLDANTMPVNEAALVDAVCRRLARRSSSRRRAVLALAASLLAAVGGTWLAVARRDTQVVVLPSDNVSSDRVPPSETSTVGPQMKPATDKTAPSAVWNDDWEEELEQAQQEVLATKESWRQPADWLATVRQRMDELEAEFDEGAL